MADETDTEPESKQGRPSLIKDGIRYCRDLRARGDPKRGKSADKVFRDALYENR